MPQSHRGSRGGGGRHDLNSRRSPIPPRRDSALVHKPGNIPPNKKQSTKAILRRLPQQTATVTNLKVRLRAMIKKRHNPDTKFLDLTTLAKDPEIENTGMFETKAREAKFFPALMAISEEIFPSGYKRKEAVMSVSLASNDLPSVTAVTTLAQTFPNIRNLDLSNNNLRDLKALEPWRRKFRYLEQLILKDNPIENVRSRQYTRHLSIY